LLTIEDRDIPNIFTPNGDGIDDTWDFNLADVYPHAIVVVFNRWGEVVFKSDQGYNIKWDGKLNGKDLPIDGYQYVITDNDKAITKGTVTIMR